MKICIATASGVEAVTKREIYRHLGYDDLAANNGQIIFDGTIRDVARANMFLRTANRVEIVMGEFKASTFDELFENVSAIKWHEIMPKNATIIVSAKSVQSKLFAYSAIQSISKKAICDEMMKHYAVSSLTENGPRFKVQVSIRNDFATVTLDTSGEGLHRRGYRGLVGEAPLKETLASAIIQLSVWNPSRQFTDVFSGTGTFPIEAALIARNIPSGINRQFDFTSWSDENEKVLEEVREEGRNGILPHGETRIFGFDIDKNQIELARKHAELAGVKEDIHFQVQDMADFSSTKSFGVMICNPPYGERLMDRKSIEKLYGDYGKMFQKLKNWSVYTLTPVTDFERLFGRRADKKRKLYNGNIECTLFSMLSKEAPPKD